ncbi:MAG: hypothetical protein M3527_07105 [Actinomycetota bacterium]|nr:hypothetical protein [Acidimicrobiia bacterium]MDQ3294200.1 hypothetical protein [Actinomycetota bacterium]
MSVLSVAALIGVGAVGVAATEQLDASAAPSADIEQAVRELDAAPEVADTRLLDTTEGTPRPFVLSTDG